MNWDAIGAMAELLGAVGVVASFVYLATQIRQNSRSVEAATYHSTTRARNELNLAVATSPELSALLLRAGDESATLTAEERWRFEAYMWGAINLFEDSFVQHTKGLLTLDHWRATRWAIEGMLSRPGASQWVKHNLPGFTEAFQKEIISLIARTEE